ncbi:hypothetical protein Ahy_B06g081961 [Arachis hypogaea]|uniref:Aminotransferase-like plant mobile domain-containing protein n=1 Tax=Arachis hypogaea TaxID=3818 RepID=A0A444YMK3_ARAHY|nr:hypothetical protein Ahy_B06g081961 [Arachis hypogaea]
MSGDGINVEENLNRLDEFHIAAHLLHKPTRVLTPHGKLVDVFMSDPADPSMEIRRQRLEPYLRQIGFYHASLIKPFEYDNPLISAFVERWRPETHTFHRFHNLGGSGHVGLRKFNIKLNWLRNRLQQMPLNLQENALIQYARCYILYLLGGVLLSDKANNTVHVRYLPLLADYDAISTYSWGSTVLCWLYRAMCLAMDYNVEGMGRGNQGPPNPPLNIDTVHRQSAHNDDGWWPVRLSEWFENKVVLSTPEALHDSRVDDIPAGAPTEYRRAPVVRLPLVLQDRRRRCQHRGRGHGHAEVGDDEPELPE